MTAGTTETPRANRFGDPCPPWCIQDHHTVVIEAREDRPALYADSHVSAPMTDGGPFAPRVYVGSFAGDPRVFASSLSATLHARTGYAAGELAKFIEQLAAYSPEQLRQMGADVRAAAAVIVAAG